MTLGIQELREFHESCEAFARYGHYSRRDSDAQRVLRAFDVMSGSLREDAVDSRVVDALQALDLLETAAHRYAADKTSRVAMLLEEALEWARKEAAEVVSDWYLARGQFAPPADPAAVEPPFGEMAVAS